MPGEENRPGRKRRRRFDSRGASRGHDGRPAGGNGTVNRRARGPVSPNRRKGFGGGERPYDYSFYESEPATPEYMERLFKSHNFAVTRRQLEQFWTFYEMLRERNASLDLTRIMGIEATVLKHFVDSALIADMIELRGPVLDIGSGPGFPGGPLAVMRPETRFILAESRGKRVEFLEELKDRLKLDNVEIWPRSVREDSPFGKDRGRPVQDVVTRALETISSTLGRVRPFVPPGGRVVFMKGPHCGGEIAEAADGFGDAFRLLHDIEYDLPRAGLRRLAAFERL